jgi:hypothetical protein
MFPLFDRGNEKEFERGISLLEEDVACMYFSQGLKMSHGNLPLRLMEFTSAS